jgi:AcrR family transcriptional regulator
VFALKGYAATSMDDVAMAAGCSKGGLYHHFATKSAVLTGVVQRLLATGALLPPFRAESGELNLQPDAVARILIEIWAEATHDHALRDQLRAAYEGRLAASIRSAASIIDILRIGAMIQLLAHGEAVDADEAARRLGIEQAA